MQANIVVPYWQNVFVLGAMKKNQLLGLLFSLSLLQLAPALNRLAAACASSRLAATLAFWPRFFDVIIIG